jgi:hypothetical protein
MKQRKTDAFSWSEKPGFDIREMCLIFVVDDMVQGRLFSEYVNFPVTVNIPPMMCAIGPTSQHILDPN